jgi:hypothetical protein
MDLFLLNIYYETSAEKSAQTLKWLPSPQILSVAFLEGKLADKKIAHTLKMKCHVTASQAVINEQKPQ